MKKTSQSIYGGGPSIKKRIPEKSDQKPSAAVAVAQKLSFTRTIKPLFQSYPQDWSIRNQKDESSLEKTILLLLETLTTKLYNFQVHFYSNNSLYLS